MSKDLSRSVRLTQLQNYLSMKSLSGGVSMDEIITQFGLTKRQIYRDLDDIENTLKLKLIRPKRGQKGPGKYKLDENMPLKIGPETAGVIFLSMLRQKGGPLGSKINEIKDLLVAALFKNRYSSYQGSLEQLQSKIHIVDEQLSDEKKPAQNLLKLLEAIKDCRVISLKYRSGPEQSKRDLEPYGLTCKHNVWYVVGHCRKSAARRTFRLDLIEDVYVRSEKYEYPDDFSLKDYFGDSWGIFAGDNLQKITIKVAPEIAYRFDMIKYHPSQTIEKRFKDGSLKISYHARGISEFLGWVLQLAEYVEILEPEEMRQEMKAKLEKVLAKYKQKRT